MSNVVSLAQVASQPVAEVVELLEGALESARAGRIIGVALVTAEVGRCEGTAFAVGEGAISTLVCGAERLKLRLLEVGQ
jgi:hypothetical protein